MNETTAVTTQKHTVKTLVESPAYQQRFRQVLGEKAQQFVTSLVNVSQDWKLVKCDPHSVIAAALTAAALDLPINPTLGFAYIIPYGDKATFQIGYKGLVQLATRSGQYKRLNVTPVYEGELLKYDRVKADVVVDESKRIKGAKVIGYVAYFELTNGAEHAEYWSAETVWEHAKRFSQAVRNNKKDSPWFTDLNAMGNKTVLKSLLSHWGPLSVQMQRAVVEDQGYKMDIDSAVVYPDNAPIEVSTAEPVFAKAERKPSGKKANTAPGEQAPATAPATEGKETLQQELVRELTSANVPFDDLSDYLVQQGIMADAKSLPGYGSLPLSVAEVFAAVPKHLTTVIRVYGKPSTSAA